MTPFSLAAALLFCAAANSFTAQAPANGPILHGRIDDETGKPRPGVRVVLYGGIATRFRGQTATTDANGEYRFDPLSTGALMQSDEGGAKYYTGVKIEHDSYVPADGQSWRDIKVLTVDRHEEVLDFRMTRGGKIRGVVFDVETEKPLADLGLRIYNGFLDGVENGSFLTYATTGKDGEFESDPLYPDRYVIDINDNSFLDKYRFPKIGKAEVKAGEIVEVRMTSREPPDLQDPFEITGTAKSTDGKSVVYGSVSVRIVGDKNKLRAEGGGIDGRSVFGLRFGPTERSEPTASAPYGVGTRDIELAGPNNRFGYKLIARTPSDPLRITDDPNQPELENGVRYLHSNRPMEFELVFAKEE